MIVDAHHHFWRIGTGRFGWIDDSLPELRRDYLPEHLRHYLRAAGIDRTILVQASETLDDNAFLLEMAAEEFVGGVVAWVDLTAPDAAARIEALAAHPVVRGIRPVLQGIADTEWVLRADVLSALATLPALGLRFDALVQPRHLGTILALTERLPDLRVVIDHGAKPVIAGGTTPADDWLDGMAALAERPQVFCKLSGLATEQGHGWTMGGLRPVCDHLLATFGPERLMWGSDWPVLERHGSYPQWLTAARALVPEAHHAQVFGATATAFYGL